jgi:phosphohistidine phosphatase
MAPILALARRVTDFLSAPPVTSARLCGWTILHAPPSGHRMPERTLILLRHAKSDWSGGESDIARPLSKRGRRQAPDAGRWLAASIDRIGLAVLSPAKRARSTWDLVSAELDVPPPTRIDDRVYTSSDKGLLGVVHELSDDVDTVVLVGHNPAIEDLVSVLTGERVPMPTSALAMIEVTGSWSTAGHSPAVLRAAGRPPGGQSSAWPAGQHTRAT